MPQIAITTSQNVNVNFSVASIGLRIGAFIIDTLIKLLYLFLIYYLFFNNLNHFNGIARDGTAVILFILGFPVYIYTLVQESLMDGQTIGKKIVNIRVVKIDGYQASFGDYLIRWIFNLVDIYSNFAAIGITSLLISKNTQRLGDIASGTAVIALKNNINISHTILENLKEGYVPSFPQVVALSDNDIRIIKENYQRALRSGDQLIMRRLSTKIKEILKLPTNLQDFTERRFIDTVIKDYNFYTGREG